MRWLLQETGTELDTRVSILQLTWCLAEPRINEKSGVLGRFRKIRTVFLVAVELVQRTQPGEPLAVAFDHLRGDIFLYPFLPRDEVARHENRQVQTHTRGFALERAMPGIAVVDNGRPDGDFDGNNKWIGVGIVLISSWITTEPVSTGNDPQTTILFCVVIKCEVAVGNDALRTEWKKPRRVAV